MGQSPINSSWLGTDLWFQRDATRPILNLQLYKRPPLDGRLWMYFGNYTL